MQRDEYKVIPAPRRGEKAPGIKRTEDRFAHALTQLMNQQARDGWEYVRAETLPCDERSGLTGTATHYHNLLVFRRVIAAPAPAEMEPLRLTAAERPPLSVAEPLSSPPQGLMVNPPAGKAPPLSPLSEAGAAPALGPVPGRVGQGG